MFSLVDIELQRQGRTILQIDQLCIDTGKFTVILGHNGSGKSTMMNLLARQTEPDRGAVVLHDQPLRDLSQRQLARQIAYLPQYLPPVAGLTVTELVRLGRFPWRGLLGRIRQNDMTIIQQSMALTDVTGYADHLVDELSGGERQRAWIAMLLAQQSPVLMLDEPTSALDPAHQHEMMKLLQQLNRESGRGILVILHDLNLALRFADQIIALRQGEVFYQGDSQGLADPDTITRLYGMPVVLLDHPDNNTKVVAPC